MAHTLPEPLASALQPAARATPALPLWMVGKSGVFCPLVNKRSTKPITPKPALDHGHSEVIPLPLASQSLPRGKCLIPTLARGRALGVVGKSGVFPPPLQPPKPKPIIPKPVLDHDRPRVLQPCTLGGRHHSRGILEGLEGSGASGGLEEPYSGSVLEYPISLLWLTLLQWYLAICCGSLDMPALGLLYWAVATWLTGQPATSQPGAQRAISRGSQICLSQPPHGMVPQYLRWVWVYLVWCCSVYPPSGVYTATPQIVLHHVVAHHWQYTDMACRIQAYTASIQWYSGSCTTGQPPPSIPTPQQVLL